MLKDVHGTSTAREDLLRYYHCTVTEFQRLK